MLGGYPGFTPTDSVAVRWSDVPLFAQRWRFPGDSADARGSCAGGLSAPEGARLDVAVWKAEIKVGEDYALREGRDRGAPLQHIRILEHVRRNKWKVQWIEPNPGLIDYIESKSLVVRWKDRKAFLRDEDHERALREHNER